MSKSRRPDRPRPAPDLEQQRKRAKELLKAQRRGDADATLRVQKHLPRAAGLTPAQARALPFKLADAQLVVAREAGFASWPRLVQYVARSAHDDLAPSPLEAAVAHGDLAALRAALAEKPELWRAREALEIAVWRTDGEAARLLLAYGCWPDHAGRRWGRHGGCLHAALLLGRPLELMQILLDGGASVAARDRDGRTPLAIAVRTGQPGAATRLRDRGANESEISELDRALGACIGGDHPDRPAGARLLRSDHQHVCWATRTGHEAALPALLRLGLDPDVPDDDGETALHLAVAARSLAALDTLLAANVQVDALSYRNETALTAALREPDDDLRDAMARRLEHAGARRQDLSDRCELFEEAADAVVAGELPRLAALLDREPRLVTARSLRTHASTLLHYVAANGVEAWRQRSPKNAGAVAALLLARGADANALAFTYGGGPAQTPLALTVSSVHPERAGVMEDVVSALIRGGAKLNGLDGDRPLGGHGGRMLEVLVAAGARVDLRGAAALGRLDLVESFVARDGTLAPGAKMGPHELLSDQEMLDRAFLAGCRSHHPEVVEHLLRAGARIDAREGDGMTGLHVAAWICDLPMMRLLVEHGAPLEARNDYGGTVLDFLVWVIENQWREGRDYVGAVEMLIAAGADLGAVAFVPTGREAIDAVFRRHGKTG